jgi:hypothetical protein
MPVLKKAVVDLNLGRRSLNIRWFIADITADFVLGLDVVTADDA